MHKPSGLGRGLSSLIPNRKISATDPLDDLAVSSFLKTDEKIWQIPVGEITPNPHQPRQHFGEEELRDLADSIKEHGIIQPLIVSKLTDHSYQLIAGERRWRCAKMIALATVPAIIRDYNEQKKLEIALLENLQRQDLNALEVALAYRKLIDEFNLTHEEMAKKVGKSRPVIANTLRLLTADPAVKQAMIDGTISDTHARVLVGLPPEQQREYLRKIFSDHLTVKQLEDTTQRINPKSRKPVLSPELRAIQEAIQENLGTKVEINQAVNGGKIVITYYTDDQLHTLINKLS